MKTSPADWETRVAAEIDLDETVEVARQALRFPSVNPPGDEGPLAEWLADRLAAAGARVNLIRHDDRRASLTARFVGSGGRPGLILTGHLDVVGAGERSWQHDPFGGELEDGRIYGRGAADMKGAVAAMVMSAGAIARAGAPLAGDLIVALTAGEETDSLGAQALAASRLLDGADGLIVGEPTDFEVYVAEKGNLLLEVSTRGRTAHASMPHLGQNAIHAMAHVLTALENYQPAAAAHPLLGQPTFSVGVIRGGVQPNVVPDGCTIEIDVRTLPGQDHQAIARDVEALLADVRRRHPEVDARVTPRLGRQAVETPPDGALVQDVIAAVHQVTGAAPRPGGAVYATDASVLVPALGVPMAICGPGAREQAHQTDEHIAVDALGQAAAIYALVALRRLLG